MDQIMKPDAGFGTFHHVGVAVKNLETAVEQFASLFGATRESEIIHDPAQGVRLQFVNLGSLRIEFLEPAATPSPLDSLLKRGIGMYQVCHEVRDLDAELARLRAGGATLVSPPKPAVAFDGRRVAFVSCQGMIIELLEAPER